MPKLYDLSMRNRFYNHGDVYEAIPCYRQMVAPGQRLDLSGAVKFRSANFTTPVMFGGRIEAHFFYVPLRLLWDDFMSFISQDDNYAGTFPTTATDWAFVFDRTALNQPGNVHSALYRRAFKLAYNSYLGDEENSAAGVETWFSDITADTVVTVPLMRNIEQYPARLQGDTAISASPTYDASVVPIDLREFAKALRDAQSQDRAQMSFTTGNTYVDYSRRLGVDLDWKLYNAPERLGTFGKTIEPVITRATSAYTGVTLGDEVGRLIGNVDVNIRSKRFAEWGYIVGVAAMRPVIFNDTMDHPPDSQMQTIDDFWLGDNEGGMDEHDCELLTGSTGDSIFTKRFACMRDGIHMYGAASTGILTDAPSDEKKVKYVQRPTLSVSDELGGDHLAVGADLLASGVTPISPRVTVV